MNGSPGASLISDVASSQSAAAVGVATGGAIYKNAYMYTCTYTWAPAEIFPEGGKVTGTLKNRHAFGAPYKKSTIFRRAEGAKETLYVFFSRRFR